MRFSTRIILYGSISISCSFAVSAQAGPGYLAAPIKNCDQYYCVLNVSVGTPSSNQVQFTYDFVADTGSGELWIAADPGVEGSFQIDETIGGASNVLNNSFSVAYTDGVNHTGYWQKQNVTISGRQMSTLMGGVEVPIGGMMGLAPVANDAGGLSNILQAMIDSDTTATPSFSLYLDPTVPLWSDEQGNAEILFGGVDSSRFIPPLQYVPLSNDTTAYRAQLDSISVGGKVISSTPLRFLLDSGMPALVLPQSIAEPLASIYQATPIPGTIGTQNYGYTCNSNFIQSLGNTTIDFTFGQVNITVPLQSIAIDPSRNGSCILAIANYGPDWNDQGGLLGNPFLRNTYAVFDPLNHQVAMAQALPAPATRSIIAITNSTLPFVQISTDSVATVSSNTIGPSSTAKSGSGKLQPRLIQSLGFSILGIATACVAV